ncbi:MAG: MSCRAMM family protein [Longimicrobiales bacterium]
MIHTAAIRFRGSVVPLACLGLLLAGPIHILAQEGETLQEGFTVPGTVTDAESGTPLEYAVIGIPELRSWSLSGADGSFSLEVAAVGTYQLVVVKRGWYLADTDVTLTGPKALNIKLFKEDEDDPAGVGRLVGRVFESGSGRAVSNATVRITPTGQEAKTDSRGRFLVSGISAGAVLVEIERRGDILRTDTLATFPGVTLGVEIEVSDDPAAKPRVNAEVWPQYLESVGFFRRAEGRRGSRFGPSFLESQRPANRLSDIIASAVPSLRAETGRFGQRVVTARGSGGDRCALGIYLDNSYMPGFDIDSYSVDWVQAFETYERMDVPMEYDHPCGVILLWSRRPE